MAYLLVYKGDLYVCVYVINKLSVVRACVLRRVVFVSVLLGKLYAFFGLKKT